MAPSAHSLSHANTVTTAELARLHALVAEESKTHHKELLEIRSAVQLSGLSSPQPTPKRCSSGEGLKNGHKCSPSHVHAHDAATPPVHTRFHHAHMKRWSGASANALNNTTERWRERPSRTGLHHAETDVVHMKRVRATSAASCNMTCRGIQFSELTGSLGRMACAGEVPRDLRRRSFVHYWRNRSSVAALKSRSEGVCSKASGTRWHVLTFGSHGSFRFKAKNYVCEPALRTGADTCQAANLTDVARASSRGWMAQHGVNLTAKGIGFWKWKPLLIQETLRRLPKGDVLLWMDRDLRIFNRPLDMLFCLGQNTRRGVAGFHFPCFSERVWTKRELADAMGADQDAMETVQLYAGLLVLRKTRFAEAFVSEWLSWMVKQNGRFADDQHNPAIQHPGFAEHRHDQSVLSLLAKLRGVKTFPIPSASHDPGDIWGWEAGFCSQKAQMPLPRASVNYHYRVAADHSRSRRECDRVQKYRSPPLVDYVIDHRNDSGKYVEMAKVFRR